MIKFMSIKTDLKMFSKLKSCFDVVRYFLTIAILTTFFSFLTILGCSSGEDLEPSVEELENSLLLGALRQPMEAVSAAPQAPNTGAPQVTEVGYYSNSKLTKPLVGTIRPGTTIFTKVVFSKPMQHLAADDKTARPILYYRINGKLTRYRIAKRGARGTAFVSGDAKPLQSGTDDYICKFTVPEDVRGKFTLAVGKQSADKEGNTLAKFYAHKTKLSITDNNSQPVIEAIPDQTLDAGAEMTVAVNITDADVGDTHTLNASSDDTAVATVSMNNVTFTIIGIAAGMTTITISAMDDSGQDNAAATPLTFKVAIEDPDPPDVLIYTGSTSWITPADATTEAQITKGLLESTGIHAEIKEDENSVRDWMLQTTANGRVNVLISYGVIPDSIYPRENSQPDGSIAENWIETPDGDTILNQADYLGWNSTGGGNTAGGLQNLMDIPDIRFFFPGAGSIMSVTPDGSALTPSLVNFESYRLFPLSKLKEAGAGAWFAEKIFASDTGSDQAAYADPIIVRDGNRGRLAIVHQTPLQDDPKGEVAAEIIINYLLAQ